MIDSLRRDTHYALRGLRANPGFTTIATLALACGIGATTTVVSVVNGVLLEPLPYREPDRLVNVWTDAGRGREVVAAVSALDARDFPQVTSLFDGFALGAGGDWTGTFGVLSAEGGAESERVDVSAVSANFFSVLGVAPALGRAFTEDETRYVGMPNTPNAGPDVVMLSHRLWVRRYGGDPAIVGRTILLDARPHEVVGVLPERFRLHLPAEAYFIKDAELWKPLRVNYVNPRPRSDVAYTLIGRMKRGVTTVQAQAEMDAIAARFRAEFADHAKNETRYRVIPLHDDVVKTARPVLVLVTAAAVLLLLIACANVANLLLARGASRARELTIRAALGASRARVVRQLLTEAGLLAVFAGVLGTLMAIGAIELVSAARPANLPRLVDIGVNWGVVAIAGGTSLLSVMIFGLAPAVFSVRDVRAETLRDGRAGGDTVRRARARNALIVGEIVLSLVLVAGAGLLVRSVIALQRVRPGFDVDRSLTLRVAIPMARYATFSARRQVAERIESQVAAVAGVTHVGSVSQLPLTGTGHFGTVRVPGRPETEEGVSMDLRNVTAGYFDALGTRLVDGRFISPADDSTRPPVAVIDASLARQLWPNEGAVGKRISYSVGYVVPDVEVVGVVEHVRVRDLTTDGWPQVYVSYYRNSWPFLSLVVRTAGDPAALAPAIRRAAEAAAGSDVAVYAVRPLSGIVADATAGVRFSMAVLQAIAVVALALAAIGLYGVIAYAVGQRRREFGVRLALGESPAGLRRLVVTKGLQLAGISVLIGLVVASATTHLLTRMLYEVSPLDVTTFVLSAIALLGVATVACYVPARRASRVSPIEALRSD